MLTYLLFVTYHRFVTVIEGLLCIDFIHYSLLSIIGLIMQSWFTLRNNIPLPHVGPMLGGVA